jgi:hypothetical protein
MAGGELADARHQAGIVGHVAVSEEILDRARIGLAAKARVGEKALQLGREDQGAVGQSGEKSGFTPSRSRARNRQSSAAS